MPRVPYSTDLCDAEWAIRGELVRGTHLAPAAALRDASLVASVKTRCAETYPQFRRAAGPFPRPLSGVDRHSSRGNARGRKIRSIDSFYTGPNERGTYGWHSLIWHVTEKSTRSVVGLFSSE